MRANTRSSASRPVVCCEGCDCGEVGPEAEHSGMGQSVPLVGARKTGKE